MDTTSPVVGLTERAIREVKRLQQVEGTEGMAFRIGVKGGGCSGLAYTMNFDPHVAADDHVYEIDGIKVVIDAKSSIYLQGTQLDYQKDLVMTGFTFINPNAKKSCGCGESFDIQ